MDVTRTIVWSVTLLAILKRTLWLIQLWTVFPHDGNVLNDELKYQLNLGQVYMTAIY